MAEDFGAMSYDTAMLIHLVTNLKTAQSFLLDTFFPNVVMSDTESVAIDVDIGLRRLAPFVSPLVEGKLVEQRRYQTNWFKPAYIKDKRAPDLRKPIRRMIGERLMGVMSPGEREMLNLQAELADQVDMITRRLEWMASQVLQTGTVTVQGDGYPTCLVDFGRDAGLTVAKTGTGQWTAANCAAGNASPTFDIEFAQRLILKLTGATVTDIVFTTSAWEGFIADPLLKGATIFPQLVLAGNVMNIGAQIARGAIMKGNWGQYRLWLYNDWYIDSGTEGGTLDKEYPIIPDGGVVVSGPMMEGTRGFGVILDPDHNYSNLPMAPKTWVMPDPAQRYIMMQSSPIIIPARVNACCYINACPSLFTGSFAEAA